MDRRTLPWWVPAVSCPLAGLFLAGMNTQNGENQDFGSFAWVFFPSLAVGVGWSVWLWRKQRPVISLSALRLPKSVYLVAVGGLVLAGVVTLMVILIRREPTTSRDGAYEARFRCAVRYLEAHRYTGPAGTEPVGWLEGSGPAIVFYPPVREAEQVCGPVDDIELMLHFGEIS